MKKVFWIYSMIFTGIIFLFVTNCKKEEIAEKEEIATIHGSKSDSLLQSASESNSDPKSGSDSGSISISDSLYYPLVLDADNNVYHPVKIGTQVWLVENLRTTKYLNGDPIPSNLSAEQWCEGNIGACKIGGDTYGNVYNAYAVEDSRKICPAGWHVPSASEWDTLSNYLGGGNIAGGPLKETGTTHWLDPNVGATNRSGFTALPGGNYSPRAGSEYIQSVGSNAAWWSCSKELLWFWAFQCSFASTDGGISEWLPISGLSVRCVKGDPDPLTLVTHPSTTIIGQAPTATTNPATDISPYAATLNGTVNAFGLPTIVTFEYGATTNYGNTDTAYQSPVKDNFIAVNRQIRDVTPLTIYHYRVKAENAAGTVYGNDIMFTIYGLQIPQIAPYFNGFVTNMSSTGATLHSTINANGLPTIVTFDYGTTTSYGNTVTAHQNPITGDNITEVSGDISGLWPGTFYHFRAKAENSNGIVYGSDCYFKTFTCNQGPSATTLAATYIDSTGAVTLNGIVNANDLLTTITFLIPIPRGGGMNYSIPALQNPVTGTLSTNVTKDININNYGGFVSGTRRYRIKAENSCGTAYGAWMSISFPSPNLNGGRGH
jgi:uncharacterized protein (TIGR02145 family)